MKTRQQRRDEEFNRSIEPHLPPVLTEMVRRYVGSELSLSPLERDERGEPHSGSSNELVAQHIFREFGENYPGSALFQDEIAETHHRKTLDHLFLKKGLASFRPDLLKAIQSNNPTALQQRRQELRSVVNYLSFSKCEQLLAKEMTAEEDDSYRNELTALKSLNSNLLIEALKLKRHSPETEIIRQQELEFNRGKAILKHAHIQLKMNNHQANNFFLKALQIFCNLNKKREAVDVVIQLIGQDSKFPGMDFDDTVKLFSAAKALCLCYPVAGDLYAKLLFAMDEPCYRRSELALLKKFYHEAETSHLQLRYSYKTVFNYRHIMADFRAGLSSLTAMNRVNSALDYGLFILAACYEPSPFNDLSRTEFFRHVAKLYQFAGRLTELHAMRYEQYNEQQCAESLSLIKNQNPEKISSHFVLSRARYPGLECQSIAQYGSPKTRLLSASANYYKNALKLLIAFDSEEEPETKQLCVDLFDDLVKFYRKHRDVEALEKLFHKKTISDFSKIPEFKSRLPVWRKVLRQLKGGVVSD